MTTEKHVPTSPWTRDRVQRPPAARMAKLPSATPRVLIALAAAVIGTQQGWCQLDRVGNPHAASSWWSGPYVGFCRGIGNGREFALPAAPDDLDIPAAIFDSWEMDQFTRLGVAERVAGTVEEVPGLKADPDKILAVWSEEVTLCGTMVLPGDANLDGVVDRYDFGVWFDHKYKSGTDWLSGDFNGDRITDGLDFIIWNRNKFRSVEMGPSIPEPAVPALTGLCLLTLFCRTKARWAFGRPLATTR